MQDTFTFLSQFAQSWALAGMAVFFVAAVLWLFVIRSRFAVRATLAGAAACVAGSPAVWLFSDRTFKPFC